MGLSDSTADIIVTVLTVVSILALLSLPSHKTLLRGRKHIHCGLSAVTLAILSQIFTCAAYWQIAKENTVADYETNATFDKNKLTIILGAIGVVTLWIAQLQGKATCLFCAN
ncbi:hypothetical protein BCR33DRAFT_358135 [Rhizoclosmatium globosum]|uniref:Uncharacterized protein n=1 Tax=Rhizoclosmatium globosum TaxID=329046 RepID=A0A1Y2C142_9FUNG|nr:hypothetical protein BCR33DRAFT_358135 [Rhizoclosmatium globosum]|eukprot:ORY40763.1 hypothetical protein BCR33DRAFT_358135 [Rhizoclosmatium globosum]